MDELKRLPIALTRSFDSLDDPDDEGSFASSLLTHNSNTRLHEKPPYQVIDVRTFKGLYFTNDGGQEDDSHHVLDSETGAHFTVNDLVSRLLALKRGGKEARKRKKVKVEENSQNEENLGSA